MVHSACSRAVPWQLYPERAWMAEPQASRFNQRADPGIEPNVARPGSPACRKGIASTARPAFPPLPRGSCGLGSPGTARRGRAGPGGGRRRDVPEGIPAARSHRSTGDATMQIGKVFHRETQTFLTRKAPERTDGCLMLEAVPRENPMYGISGGEAGNVAYVGTANPPRNRKGGAGNPPPTGARASAPPNEAMETDSQWLDSQ